MTYSEIADMIAKQIYAGGLDSKAALLKLENRRVDIVRQHLKSK